MGFQIKHCTIISNSKSESFKEHLLKKHLKKHSQKTHVISFSHSPWTEYQVSQPSAVPMGLRVQSDCRQVHTCAAADAAASFHNPLLWDFVNQRHYIPFLKHGKATEENPNSSDEVFLVQRPLKGFKFSS